MPNPTSSNYDDCVRDFYAYLPDEVRSIFINDAIYHKQRYLEMLQRSYGHRVLELGSDKPFITHFLRQVHAPSAFETVSIDIPYSPYPITRIDIESAVFPFGDGHFSDVIFTEVIEHLFRDPAWTVCELNRVLETGGRLFLTTPNACGYDAVVNLLNQSNPNARSQFFASIESGHPHLWTAQECRTLLEAHGFVVDRLDTVDYVPFPYPDALRRFLKDHSVAPDMHGQSLRVEAHKVAVAPRPVYPPLLFPEGKPVQLQGALREWAVAALGAKA
jgi:SAM-dependent methyltransferase